MNPPSRKTCLVTGATGFIGGHLCAALEREGVEVVELRRTPPRGPGGRRHVCFDLARDEPVEIPPGVDTIFHLAGKAHAVSERGGDDATYRRINTDGTRRLLEAAARAGVRSFVFFSSVKAVGDSPPVGRDGAHLSPGEPAPRGPEAWASSSLRMDVDAGATVAVAAVPQALAADLAPEPILVLPRPIDETCTNPPDSAYGRSKRDAEHLVLNGGHVDHPVVIRPSLVYGPGHRGNLEAMIGAVRAHRFPPLPEVGNKRSTVHVEDLVAAALLVSVDRRAAGRTYIVADRLPFSTRQMFEWMCGAVGREIPRWTVPLWSLRLVGRVGDLIGRVRGRRFVFDTHSYERLTGDAWYSSERIQRELGWRPEHTLFSSLPELCARSDEADR